MLPCSFSSRASLFCVFSFTVRYTWSYFVISPCGLTLWSHPMVSACDPTSWSHRVPSLYSLIAWSHFAIPLRGLTFWSCPVSGDIVGGHLLSYAYRVRCPGSSSPANPLPTARPYRPTLSTCETHSCRVPYVGRNLIGQASKRYCDTLCVLSPLVLFLRLFETGSWCYRTTWYVGQMLTRCWTNSSRQPQFLHANSPLAGVSIGTPGMRGLSEEANGWVASSWRLICIPKNRPEV